MPHQQSGPNGAKADHALFVPSIGATLSKHLGSRLFPTAMWNSRFPVKFRKA